MHLHGKGEKYSLLSLINLQEPEKYQHEYWLYTHEYMEKLKALQNANQNINCGVASNVSYFTSKNGNPCVRYNAHLSNGEVLEGRIKVFPPLMCEGSFIFFYIKDKFDNLLISQVDLSDKDNKNLIFLDIIEVA